MKLIDSNIIIYSFQTGFEFLKPLVIDPSNGVSAISRLEIFGFHNIQPDEEIYCSYVFNFLKQIPVDDIVLNKAIELRRQYKLKLADSIIASTAMLNEAELITRNIADFIGIDGLIVSNPII